MIVKLWLENVYGDYLIINDVDRADIRKWYDKDRVL